MTFGVVPPDQVAGLWPQLERGIVAAMEGVDPEASPADVLDGLVSGRLKLFMLGAEGGHVCVVAKVEQFHKFSVLRVLYCFGRGIDQLDEASEQMDNWARFLGCKYVEAWVAGPARKRLFSRIGFKEHYTILRKTL